MNITHEQYQEWLKQPPYTILTDPDTHSLENKKGEFYYTDDLFYTMPDPDDPNKVVICVVLKGTVVNGASIPWFLQGLIPKEGKYNRPSAVHDDGYERGGVLILLAYRESDIVTNYFHEGITCIVTNYFHEVITCEENIIAHDKYVLEKLPMTQKQMDYLYLKLMEGRGVAKWNRNAQYRGLRLGGWYAWNKYRKKDK